MTASLRVAGEIGEYRVRPTRQQIFMFSAATWNRHHVHYDKDAAQSEGLEDVVVQRALLGNFLGQLIERWLSGKGAVRRLEWTVRRSALPDRELVCTGEVTDADNGGGVPATLLCSLRILDPEGQLVAEGRATVELNEGVTLDG
jgi:hydroxyacyl-ACP dehydratase HTD2-like protein with hotdog domain